MNHEKQKNWVSYMGQLVWPLKKPSSALFVRDLGKNDHIVIFPIAKQY